VLVVLPAKREGQETGGERGAGKGMIKKHPYVRCPGCDHQVQERQDEDERKYYKCLNPDCGGEYTLDGFPRPQGQQECHCGSDKMGIPNHSGWCPVNGSVGR